jgi:hypothetical protein
MMTGVLSNLLYSVVMMQIQFDMLESICDEILSLDPMIRFAGMIDDKGRLLAKSKKIGTKIILDPKDQEIFLMEIALGVRMRREHDEHIGPVKFAISCGDRINSIIIPLSEKILYLSTEKEIDMLKIVFLILRILEKNMER